MNKNDIFQEEIRVLLNLEKTKKEKEGPIETIQKNITCKSCEYNFRFVPGEHPNGPCPGTCPDCKESLCPICGNGDFTGEYIEYCGYGCSCGWEHCGGCV